MFTRILVPIDFSSASDAALEYARMLAAHFGSSVELLHVVEDPAASAYTAGDEGAPIDEVRKSMLTQARERLAHVTGVAVRGHFQTRAHALLGMPAPAIIAYAAVTGATLIVMGTHGRTGLAHLLMGSVAEHVVRTSPCPVLTVREPGVVDAAGVPMFDYRLPMPA